MAHCDASLHDAGMELKSIQAFFNDAMQGDTTPYVYCEPTFVDKLIRANVEAIWTTHSIYPEYY